MNQSVIAKLSTILKAEGASALMVAPSPDMQFLTNSSPFLCERFQSLVVKDDGDFFYICNLLTVDEAREFMDDHPVYGWFDCDDFTDTVKLAFEKHGLIGKTIAVNGAVRAFNICEIQKKMDVNFINGKDFLERTRIIKTAEEMKNLRKASEVSDQVFSDIVKIIRPGITEEDIQKNLYQLTLKHGGIPNGKGGLVASGSNAALPHYFGGKKVIGTKDIVQMDYGCSVNGMRSDMTRTVFVGEPTEREKEIYNIVLKANLAGEAAAVNGAYIPDIEAAARGVIINAGFGPYFTHRLGHGIGYAGHESPNITAVNRTYLEPGMAFSIEPGIYIKDEIGIRIEDLVLINENGEQEILNKASKEIIVIQ